MATRPECDDRHEHRARILAEAIAGGREALRRQAARHAPRRADADDVLQEACVEFLRYYEGEPGEHALRYLMVAVKHRAWAQGTCASHRHSTEVNVTTTDALIPGKPQIAVLCQRPGPAEGAESRERLLRQVAILAGLKPDQRTAIVLVASGYSYREIAARQGWTNTKVNRCLAEGRAALRALGEGGRDSAAEPLEG